MKQIRVKHTGQNKQQKQKFIVIDAYLFYINRNLPQLLLLKEKQGGEFASNVRLLVCCSFGTHNIFQRMTRRCRSLFPLLSSPFAVQTN